MDLWEWTTLFILETLVLYWVVYRGGAAWLEGWKAAVFIHWFAARWSAEGIRLCAFVLWWMALAWFIVGVFEPELRIGPWPLNRLV